MYKTLLEQLKDQAEYKKFNSGEIIIRQGHRADAFFVLLNGTVDVIRTSGSGVPHKASSMTAPAFFGEKGLFEEGRRTATVRASGAFPVELLAIPRKAFMEFVDGSEMMADEVAALIQKYRISDSLIAALGQLSPEQVEKIAALAQIQTFTQGEDIICQGDPAKYFYILTRGRVEVLHERVDGQTYMINFHEPGEYFGEIGLLQNRSRSATVRAVDDGVEVLAFGRNVFQNLLSDSLETETAIAREMVQRLSRQEELQED